ncbi:MAG: ABC transporter permease [Desulfarculus sp.]|jgi:ABC-type nitrate/sulfonate/bicarbonate transport system permease component|nr:MAG: ABC transporter permease [Desulfarculus sp.]
MRLGRWWLPLALLVLWQGLCSLGVFPPYKLPSPLAIIAGLVDLASQGMPPGQRLHWHLLYSLLRVGAGFAAAALIGVPLGLIMGASPRAGRLVSPLIEMLRPVPPLAWIPISILWFGIGLPSAGFIIFLGAFFPIVLNTIAGVTSVSPLLVEAVRTLGAGRREIVRKVLLPGALPNIFVGLRIGLGIGWMTLVAAEFTGVKSGYGLGYMIMTARDIQRPDEIMAGMAVIGLTGLCIDGLVRLLQRRLVPWQ